MLLSGSRSTEQIPALSVGPERNMVEAFRLAATALGDMQQHRICPTPEAYELWLAHLSGTNPALTRRMTELLRSGERITPAMIAVLRKEFETDPPLNADEAAGDHYLVMSDSLQDAADDLVQQVDDGRVAIRDYGEVLAQTVVRLGDDPNGDESMRIIAMLTSETLKMAELNRDLRDELASTSARVGKLRRMLAEEKQAASTDPLTGLSNRRVFETQLKRATSKPSSEPGGCVSLLLLDVDHFKRFNDTYGHSTGDLVLRLVGRLLTDSIKGRDVAARYGGEEFAILLMGADLDAAAKVARQICTTLAAKRLKLASATETGEGRVTISIGVAQIRGDDTPRALIDRADAALYAAKRGGRNRVMTEIETVTA